MWDKLTSGGSSCSLISPITHTSKINQTSALLIYFVPHGSVVLKFGLVVYFLSSSTLVGGHNYFLMLSHGQATSFLPVCSSAPRSARAVRPLHGASRAGCSHIQIHSSWRRDASQHCKLGADRPKQILCRNHAMRWHSFPPLVTDRIGSGGMAEAL